MPGMSAEDLQGNLDLVDWRRQMADIYRLALTVGVEGFREERDRILATHPQSPIPDDQRASFRGVEYFANDPTFRLPCDLEPAAVTDEIEIDTGGPDGVIHYRRVGIAHFQVQGVECHLTVLALIGYGGGLFLPFRDATSGTDTYGGGRYLFDTIKNHIPMPPPVAARQLVELDFNYAYNPSCAYNHRWACPLAPPENRLPVPVTAGEKSYRPSSWRGSLYK